MEIEKRLAGEPSDVADAVDRIAHVAVFRDWLKNVEAPIREWLDDKADQIEADVGGAFNVPIKGVGKVWRTNPDPKPTITDYEALGRYLAGLEGIDPDEPFDHERLAKRPAATCASDDLLRFLDSWAAAADDPDGQHAAAAALADVIVVEEHWIVDPSMLDRFKTAGDSLVDETTGDKVPGVEVTTGKRTLTVTPDKQHKATLRQQLDDTIALAAEQPQ